MNAGSAILVLLSLTAMQVPQPPKPATQPGPVADRSLEASARDALQQYSEALESLDADLVKKIQPSVDVEGLKRAFRDMRALKVTIEDVRVLSSEGPVLRVSCRVSQALTPKAGKMQNTAVTRVLRLRRQEAVWVIDAFER